MGIVGGEGAWMQYFKQNGLCSRLVGANIQMVERGDAEE